MNFFSRLGVSFLASLLFFSGWMAPRDARWNAQLTA
jgi:hypothetical protein